MRAGLPLSVSLHLAMLAAGITVAPALVARPEPMVILPVELLTIADETSVRPVVAREPEETPDEDAPGEVIPDAEADADPVVSEVAEAEPARSEPAPADAPTAEPEPIAPVPAPKAEAAKPEPKPEAPPARPSFDLESVMKSVERNKQARTPPKRSTTDIARVDDAAAPRRGAGDEQRMTITVADFIRTQLLQRGCWRGAADMPDAARLRAVIRVRFNRDGTFASPPELRSPTRPPQGDMPMQTFVQRGFRALNRCEPFDVPPEYFTTSPWIDIEFLPES
ncbi:hypothetical protein GC169_01935 [bacterium]|nr:hypothetical protein [bacterium]